MSDFDFRTPNEQPAVLTVSELSRVLRIGINGAYDLVRTGKIPSVRVGRQFRIPRQAVAEYLGQSD